MVNSKRSRDSRCQLMTQGYATISRLAIATLGASQGGKPEQWCAGEPNDGIRTYRAAPWAVPFAALRYAVSISLRDRENCLELFGSEHTDL